MDGRFSWSAKRSVLFICQNAITLSVSSGAALQKTKRLDAKNQTCWTVAPDRLNTGASLDGSALPVTLPQRRANRYVFSRHVC